MTKGTPNAKLLAEMAELRSRLAEAEETLRAIGSGEADALVLSGDREPRIQLVGAGDRVYRQFLEASVEGTATVSPDGKILSCNAALAKSLQRPLDALLGTKLSDHLSPEDHRAVDALLTEEGTGVYRQIVHLVPRDCAPIPEYLSATRLESSEAEPISCLVFTDVREVISAELTLRESEKLYRELLELAPVGIAVVLDGKVVFVNPAEAHLLGADSEEQIIGKSVEQIVHPDDLEKTRSRDGKVAYRRNRALPARRDPCQAG